MKTLTTILKEFKNTHKNLYDYSLVEYTGMYNKVKIICKTHGTFEQKPANHKFGNGCPKCGKIVSQNKRHPRKNDNNLINDLKSVCPDYNYSKVKYINSYSKIEIICKLHGSFFPTYNNFVNKNSRCPECALLTTKNLSYNYVHRYSENKELGNKPGIFYKIIFEHKTLPIKFLKVGITSTSIKRRYARKLYKNYEYRIIQETKTTNLESALLEREYLKLHSNNKFKFPLNISFIGKSECFNIKEI